MGGFPVLGYDLDPNHTRLVVNEAEAEQVRAIFGIFLRRRSLMETLTEVQERGCRLKSWTTREGEWHEGKVFDRHSLARLLANAIYLGEMRYKEKLYRGEHPAIVERKVWRRANELLDEERRGRAPERERNRHGAVLKNLLVCAACGNRMVPGFTSKQGRRYFYYVCRTAQRDGARQCGGGIISATRMESAVVAGLYETAARADGEPLRRQLPVPQGKWEQQEKREQQRIVEQVVEAITYDGRMQRGAIRLRREIAAANSQEIIIAPGRKAVLQQNAPDAVAQSNRRVLPAVPRITKLMALAIRLEELMEQGVAHDYTDLARLGGVSRSRITQILNLRNLAPVLQERILQWQENGADRRQVTEGAVRQICGILDWRQQIIRFDEVAGRAAPKPRRQDTDRRHSFRSSARDR